MVTRFTFLLPMLTVLCACDPGPGPARPTAAFEPARVGERSLDDRLSAKEAEVGAFCRPVESGAGCEPKPDMAWRLRNYVSSLSSYLNVARTALGSGTLTPGARERLDVRVRSTDRALAAYRRTLDDAEERVRRQSALVAQLNRDFACNISAYDQGQQVNFARELSLPECNPLVVADYRRAAETLKALADVSLPVDAAVMMDKAKYYLAVGRLVGDLDDLRRQLIDIKVVRFEHDRPRVDLIGHPFQNENNTNWLEAYIQATRKLNRELERLGEPAAVNGCPEPACDPAIYRVAEAVTLKPALDFAFLRDGDQVMAPTPYGLSFFSQRFDANGPVRWSLDLGSNREWKWRSEDYVNMLNPDDHTLTFTHVFAEEQITLSVARWEQRTEFPYVVPIFYLFQEARRVIDLLKGLRGNPVAARIRDIRFAPADPSGDFVAITQVPEGLRLTLSVMRPAGQRPIADVRQDLHRQIPIAVGKAGETL